MLVRYLEQAPPRDEDGTGVMCNPKVHRNSTVQSKSESESGWKGADDVNDFWPPTRKWRIMDLIHVRFQGWKVHIQLLTMLSINTSKREVYKEPFDPGSTEHDYYYISSSTHTTELIPLDTTTFLFFKMFIYKLLPAALAAASALPSAMAAQCTAKGSIEGAGFGLTKSITITTGDSTFQYSAGDTGDNICGRVLMQTSKPSNLKRTKGNGNLASPVVWYGDCNGDGWR